MAAAVAIEQLEIEAIGSVDMQDIVGHYDVPDDVPEWLWVQQNASFAHVRNGLGDGVWEFILNLSRSFTDIPPRLAPTINNARLKKLGYLVLNQGT